MENMNSLDVIGMGLGRKDITQNHMKMIKRCDVLVGGRRHLEMFDLPDVQKIPIQSSIDRIVNIIKEKIDNNRIVVLASGDPLFHGIGSTLIHHFDKKQIRIHSNISSVSAAFAAIKEPWHNAKIVSLHGKLKNAFQFSSIGDVDKIAFLTDPENDPGYIASQLKKHRFYNFKLCVLENLGDKSKEKITWFHNFEPVFRQNFSQPNIVILKKTGCRTEEKSFETHIGMEDSEFQHSKGLITKSEVRTITLSKLQLSKSNHVLWDIGSGSGSLGIEAALQLQDGSVYAIEKNINRISDIKDNIKKFNCHNLTVLNSEFPDNIDEIKQTPDRIFIGGGGKELKEIIRVCCEKLEPSGVLVVNTVLIQNFQTALEILKNYDFKPRAVQIQISRLKEMPFGERFESLNPVWIISGRKPG